MTTCCRLAPFTMQFAAPLLCSSEHTSQSCLLNSHASQSNCYETRQGLPPAAFQHSQSPTHTQQVGSSRLCWKRRSCMQPRFGATSIPAAATHARQEHTPPQHSCPPQHCQKLRHRPIPPACNSNKAGLLPLAMVGSSSSSSPATSLSSLPTASPPPLRFDVINDHLRGLIWLACFCGLLLAGLRGQCLELEI
jgi:hypothetical protein